MKLLSLNTVGWSTAILVSSAISASAVTVSRIDSSVQGSGNTADQYAANFDGTTPDGAVWSGGSAPVVTPPPGDAPGSYQSPFSMTPLVDSQSYFAVGGQSGDNGGPSPMTLTFATPQDQLDLLWGSIDSYNTISFLGASGDPISSFTGGDIISLFPGIPGDPNAEGNFEQVALLSFAADELGSFSSVLFESDQQAFEFGLPVAAVPVPAAVWMLLTAMAGLGFVSSRRKSA